MAKKILEEGVAKGFVEAFESFALFCKTKWRATIVGLVVISLLGAITLSLFYGYVKIKMLLEQTQEISNIVVDSHTTPADLQEDFKEYIVQNEMINKELNELRIRGNAGMTLLFKFHNSKTDLTGRHFFFYSNTNESLDDKFDYISDSVYEGLQNIPVTRLGERLTSFFNNECHNVITEDIVRNIWLYNGLKEYNIEQFITCPIYDVNDKYLMGFIDIAYNEVNNPNDTKDIMNDLKFTALKISRILDNNIIN